MTTRIPLLCLACGNAVLTRRSADEYRAAAVAMSGCPVCDDHGEGHELFYIGRDGETYDFGSWMDFHERKGK